MNTSLEELKDLSKSSDYVPNKFPTLQNLPYRIAVVGEAPGKDEVFYHAPFMGQSGKLLTQILQKKGVVREGLFIGNICQIRPPDNKIELFKFDGPEIQSGLEQLSKDLATFDPHICILLGKTALFAAKGVSGIGDWRGSLFIGERGCFIGRKCIATYHPAACLRMYDWMPLLMLDIDKAIREASSPNLTLPDRELSINLTKDEIIQRLTSIRTAKTKIALDIEGGINSWSCISIATSPFQCFIVPLTVSNGTSFWSVDDECDILTSLSDVLADGAIPKILQNSLYDRFVLQYSYGIIIFGTVDDTMLKAWEKQNELEKGLGFLCSIYTRQPYYKSDRKSEDMETFWRYCCMDSCVTYEISDTLDSLLNDSQKKHYQFNIELLNLLLYCELKGISYDSKEAKTRLDIINGHYYTLQAKLNTLAGILPNYLLSEVQGVLCFKRDGEKPKTGNEDSYARCKALLESGNALTETEKGYIATVCGWSMNVKGIGYKKYLYETLALPPQYKTNDETGSKALTTNNEALLKLMKKTPHEAVSLGIQIMELRTRSQMLSIYADPDHRIRCGYNLVGTVTGRLSSYTSPTGSGYNLQTIPDDYKSLPETHPLRQGMRDLFLADEDHWMFQCDLKGADGWTIGAHLSRLGDSTMLDDLRAGIKPAARVCYIFRHGAGGLVGKSRAEIKEMLKEIKGDDWDYFGLKIGIWGMCYLMGPDLLSAVIAKESYGEVNLTRKQVQDLSDATFATYNMRIWHRACQRIIDKPGFPKLVMPSGAQRIFYGRKSELLGEYLSTEPQNTTTYATNAAARNLWRDPENRIPVRFCSIPSPAITQTEIPKQCSPHESNEGSFSGTVLRIQPLHQVHDALIFQAKKSDTEWAINKVKSYFNNTIVIAGIPIVIPFDGRYGPSWGDLKYSM